MSCNSYTTYECTFPEGTALPGSKGWERRIERTKDGCRIEFDGETGWPEHVLDDLVALFGKPLDEVSGLSLDLGYQCYEDGYYECCLTIGGGECDFKETETRFVRKSMADCPISIGRGTARYGIRVAREIWDELGDMPVDDDGRTLRAFHHPDLGYFSKGTDREYIWHKIEDELGVSVAWLMGEAGSPDGSNG